MSKVEYHVFLVTGDHLSGPHRKAEVAERNADRFRRQCPCDADPDCESDDYGPHGIRVNRSADGYWDRSY